MKLRKGDVVVFRRGANEYKATVLRIYRVTPMVEVILDDATVYHVPLRSVVSVAVPALTEAERDTLALMHMLTGRGRHGVTLAGARRAGHTLSVTALVNLRERELVATERFGFSEWAPFTWTLTTAGRKVAGDG